MNQFTPAAVPAMIALALAASAAAHARSASLPVWDFTRSAGTQGWLPTHDIASLDPGPEGLTIRIDGNDPYMYGPARDYPANQALWLRIRLRSVQGGTGQVFFFSQAPTEEASVRFPVRAGVWEDLRVALPPLGKAFHLRLDPPGTGGSCTLALLQVQPRNMYSEPDWPTANPPEVGRDWLTLSSGPVRLVHDRRRYGSFVVESGGMRMAAGLSPLRAAYLAGDRVRWLDASAAPARVIESDGVITALTTVTDADGGAWHFRQRFTRGAPGAIQVDTEISVSRERSALFVPLLIISAGQGSFGEAKEHALFPGLEYLDQESSSSQADLTVDAYHREVPDIEKITIPLMVVQAQRRYVGLSWEKTPKFSAVFDSPDRIFKSGGNAMGLIFPGSNGSNRVEGHLLPYDGVAISPESPLELHASIVAGEGESVIPVVQQYVSIHGLPPVPASGLDLESYVRLAAAGWLDSGIQKNHLFRHALPGSFAPQPAADAALFMEWLSLHTTDRTLQSRLKASARDAIAQVDPADYDFAGVAHIRYPAESLVFGSVLENVDHALTAGRGLLGRFEPDGRVLYRPTPGKTDLGKTHFEPDANGLTAQVVMSLLEYAAVTGDPELRSEGIRVLHALDRFTNTAPRGAQTWEVPLHTPDILASAYLVRAYTLGYQLTGEPDLLRKAIEWAWTGVPFIYLSAPAAGPVGLFATIPVYGATQWVAPVWMGLPVQWCGLVYAEALYRLAPLDPSGPWKQLAEGITVSGIQQTWPRASDPLRQGLLPDSFAIRGQIRNDPAINPGTVQTQAIQLYGGPPLYDFHAFRGTGLLVHAPGSITVRSDTSGVSDFLVHGWSDRPYHVLIANVSRTPHIRLNGVPAPLAAPQQYVPAQKVLILQISGDCRVEITTGPVEP